MQTPASRHCSSLHGRAGVRVHAQRDELLTVVVHELLVAGSDETGVPRCALEADQ